MYRWPDKDIRDKKDYSVDWASRLQSGETITLSSWSVSPSGITISNDSISGSKAITWLDGGTAGVLYSVSNVITTSRGAEYAITVQLKAF